MDASAPSARCVCPRITPGCSWNVFFTRSSNSRIRAICVNIQTSRSFDRPFSDTDAPFSREVELRARRLVRSVEDLVDRETAKLLREDLDAPGAVVAELAQHGDVAGDRELAFAGQLAAVDHLVEPGPRVIVRAVRALDPGHEPRRDATEVVGLEPELPEVPRVEGETAVRRVRPLDDLERGVY